ncbi:amidase family protein [Bacillus kwashiorkori]|uniref:amidase family protein n=1 Tax=Bacillus kwashiorkori TaxID=1522318 RepID=UPI001EF03068|nr:amidase family protein [Bacillus kwashiorkori]
MARSISDLVLMLTVMAGYNFKDPNSLNVSIPSYTEGLNKGISGLKIGIPTYYLKKLDRDVEQLFNRAISALQYLGAEIKELEVPELSLATFAAYMIVTGEAANRHYKWLQTNSEDYSPDNRSFFLAGALTNTPKYVKAQQTIRILVRSNRFH